MMGNILYRRFFSFLSIATPASSHAVPLPSLLEHHSMHNLLPQEKFISRYKVNEFFSDSFAKIFCLSLSLHRSFTIFVILVRLHYCCFVHTNAVPVLYSDSFNSIVQLLTIILLPLNSCHCYTGASISKHII